MPLARIDDVVGGNDGLFPGDLFAYATASAANATAGSTTSFDGIFVDAVETAECREGWEVVHSQSIDDARMDRFHRDCAPQYHVENGAIAVIAAVLHARDGLRLSQVHQIGMHSDYSVRDRHGNPAGVIEFAGRSGQYTSDAAAEKRRRVKLSKRRPARIGIVAFGGPELRAEVVA